MTFIILIVGLLILIKSADWLVTGASSVAKKFGVSALVIGLTIVAFGTSAPELAVNLISVSQGNTQLAIGNIIGSNIVNILLILGIAAVIFPLTVKSSTVWKEIPFALLSAIVIAVMANDIFFDGALTSFIGLSDGLILIGFFIIFLYYTFGIAKNNNGDEEPVQILSLPRSLLLTIGGIAGLVLGGKLLVDSAITIATMFGMSETLIGLTVVAVGTSLPELATSAVAAFKRQSDIAIGNVVGSNIFNVFWILGVSALIKPLPVMEANNFDFLVAIGASLLLFIAIFIGKRHTIQRWQGVCFIALYVVYVVVLVMK